MKHTLLIALLGATVTLATPSISFADNGYRAKGGMEQADFQNNQKTHASKDRRNHKNKQKRFVAKSPNQKHYTKNHNKRKHGYNKHGYNKYGFNKYGYNRHGFNKHGFNKQGYNKHGYDKHKNKPSFSISWNVGDSTISYGNDAYAYNQGYDNNHNYKKQRGRKIYKRINRQANRIQNGINNGQLVTREVRKLRHEQRNIKQTMSHFKRDGYLDKYERSELNQLLNIASQNIHRKSNNRLTRYSRQNDYYVQF